MRRLPMPKVKPIDKDAVIEDLKRRLGAALYQIGFLEQRWMEAEIKAYEYWLQTDEGKNSE